MSHEARGCGTPPSGPWPISRSGRCTWASATTARRLFDEAAAASREVGDGAGEVLAGYGYGLLAHVDGDWDQARRHYVVAVDGFIALGTPVPEGVALAGLGRCDEADGDASQPKPGTPRRWNWVAGSVNRP